MSAVTIIQVIIIQFGGKVFGTTPLTLVNWVAVILIAFMIIPIDLVRKAVVKKRGSGNNHILFKRTVAQKEKSGITIVVPGFSFFYKITSNLIKFMIYINKKQRGKQ